MLRWCAGFKPRRINILAIRLELSRGSKVKVNGQQINIPWRTADRRVAGLVVVLRTSPPFFPVPLRGLQYFFYEADLLLFYLLPRYVTVTGKAMMKVTIDAID